MIDALKVLKIKHGKIWQLCASIILQGAPLQRMKEGQCSLPALPDRAGAGGSASNGPGTGAETGKEGKSRAGCWSGLCGRSLWTSISKCGAGRTAISAAYYDGRKRSTGSKKNRGDLRIRAFSSSNKA